MSGPLPLQLKLLGARAARLAGCAAPVEVLWQKHFALLAYLACSPDLSRPRGHLLAILWPERPDSRARHSLNEALHRLRTCLGADRVVTEGEHVTLCRDSLSVDAWDDVGDDPGEFLEGFALEDSQPFDEWVEGERTRRRAAAQGRLVEEGKRRLAQGRHAEAAALARDALARDPLAECLVRLLMEALALEGRQDQALVALREYRDRLAEIGEKPGPELLRLADRIRAGAPDAGLPAAGDVPPLVGRGPTLACLTGRLPLPGQDPARLLLILGEAGTGKTRILKELQDRATLAGITVATAAALASDQRRGGSTLRSLFHGGLGRAPGMRGVDAVHLRRLASLIPEVAGHAAPPPDGDVGELGYSLAEVLDASAEEAPLLLLLDDAHFADSLSLGVLQAALEHLKTSRITLALTAAPSDPDAAPELLRLQAEMSRSLPGTAVRLQPFDDPALAALVEALAPWSEPGDARDRLIRRLRHETSGNPFLVVTLLRGLAGIEDLRERAVEWPVPSETLQSPLPEGVPQLIQAAVVAQSARLTPEAREALVIAAMMGVEVDVQLLMAMTGLSEAELASRLAEAERLQLIEATDDGYGFPGVIIAQVLQQAWLTPGRRREIRRRAAELLAERGDSVSRLLRLEMLSRQLPAEAVAADALELGAELLSRGDRRRARRALAFLPNADGVAPGLRERWHALRGQLDA